MKSQQAQPERPLGSTPPPVRVLVVDDDAEMRAYMRQCLKELPVQVVEAASSREALAMIQRWEPEEVALVIADVIMPGMDGLALKAALRADQRWAHLPVVLVSGEAVSARDGPFLRKPFNARRLRAAIQSLLNLPS